MRRKRSRPDSTSPKRARLVGSIEVASAAAAPSLGPLATEVWRLGRRIAVSGGASERITDSYERLLRHLELLGVRVEDPVGQRFIEGTNAEILDLPDGADPARDELIVSDVLRPAVFIEGRCVLVPQVVLARRESSEESTHAPA